MLPCIPRIPIAPVVVALSSSIAFIEAGLLRSLHGIHHPRACGSNGTPYLLELVCSCTLQIYKYLNTKQLPAVKLCGFLSTPVSLPPIAGNVSQIVISQSKSSSNNSITINSTSVYVCSTAEGAAADNPTDVVASFTPSVTLGTDVTIDKADDTSWAGCYYRIVYNVTVTKTSNQRFQFEGVKFYGTSE